MGRSHSRLQSELERYKDSNRTQEDQRGNRLQVDRLQEQADRLNAELSSLQTAHNALRLLLVHSSQYRHIAACSSVCEIDQWEISDGTARTGTSIMYHGRQQERTGALELTCIAYICICSREEMVSERQQTAELQAKLSTSVQEKLTAEGERERLQLEIQRLKEQLKWHQEQISSTKEALSSSQKPELQTAHAESRLSPVERTKDGSVDQVTGLQGS